MNELIIDLDLQKKKTVDEIFFFFVNHFKFPDYFGDNWDAFEECINDLSWLGKDQIIVLTISHLDISNKNHAILADILEKAASRNSNIELTLDKLSHK